jgi:hypothetical protein
MNWVAIVSGLMCVVSFWFGYGVCHYFSEKEIKRLNEDWHELYDTGFGLSWQVNEFEDYLLNELDIWNPQYDIYDEVNPERLVHVIDGERIPTRIGNLHLSDLQIWAGRDLVDKR